MIRSKVIIHQIGEMSVSGQVSSETENLQDEIDNALVGINEKNGKIVAMSQSQSVKKRKEETIEVVVITILYEAK